MKLSHVVATSPKRVIGRDGQLPWHAPSDLKHFKSTTMGKILLMGRKTFESVKKPLPGRMNLVVTSTPSKIPEGDRLKVFTSIDQAITYGQTIASQWKDELCIVGGGEIYRQTLERVDFIYLTVIESDGDGDTFYPVVPEDKFKLISVQPLSMPGNPLKEPKSDLFIYEKT
jgi:dihydrofolate reductase